MTTVRIVDNDDDRFPGHTLIECIDDDTGEVAWRSWAPSDIDPAVRLAPDQYPTVADERKTTDTTEITYRVPTIDEYRQPSTSSRRSSTPARMPTRLLRSLQIRRPRWAPLAMAP